MSYVRRYDPKHPIATPLGYVAEHRVVLYDKIGPGSHPCHVCGKLVSWSVDFNNIMTTAYLTADHLDFNRRNNAPDNLAPACGVCNIQRKADTLKLRRGFAFGIVSCRQCQKEFCSPLTVVGVTTREFCSKSCSSKHKWASGQITPSARKETIKRYRFITAHGHALANRNGCVAEHRYQLYEKIGEGPHVCHWCPKVLRWHMPRRHEEHMVVDHLDNHKTNNAHDNLVASCTACNIRRAHFKDLMVMKPCEYCGESFKVNKNKSIQNPKFGRFCGRSCRTKYLVKQRGGWGRNILADEEYLIADKKGSRARASHSICQQCRKDFLYPKAGYRPKYCSSRCYGDSMIGKKQVEKTA